MVKIEITTLVNGKIENVWDAWTNPSHITKWYFASDDWEAPNAENDLKVGGKFKIKMAAKDGSASFDFEGTYTNIVEKDTIEYDLDDKRHVITTFTQSPEGVKITQTFDAENTNPIEMQRDGWQSILNNFKKHVEAGLR